MKKSKLALGLILSLLCFLKSYVTYAQIYPEGFSQVQIATGIENPTAMTYLPDGRILICQQNGLLRIYKDDALLATPALSLTVDSWFERGLLGVTYHPEFHINNYIYLYYTVPGTPARNRVSRFLLNGDIIDPVSEIVILNMDNLNAGNHNGGTLHFGPDGKLYIATGDNAVTANSQNLNNYQGKILRINADGSAPDDNPFNTTGASEAAKRIWAYGLRNPFSFVFQDGTGVMYVNDVGQNSFEEINDATMGGRNFGWPATEGTFNPATYPQYTNPVYAYGPDPSWNPNIDDAVGCAIVGGLFYNTPNPVYPIEYHGKYFFMDLCKSWINYLDIPGHTRNSFARRLNNGNLGDVLGLILGKDGYLYFLNRAGNSLYKIIYTNNTSPVVVSNPQNISRPETYSASFSVTVTGQGPFDYQWRKNGGDIPNATNRTYTIASVSTEDDADYDVVVSNVHGTITSAIARLTVTPFNARPVAQITSPTMPAFYRAGDVISFSGEATDEEDGILPATSFRWLSVLHHNTHTHDGPPFLTGSSSGTFTIPVVGETDHDVWYRLYLVVEDSQGITDTAYIEIYPIKSTFHFQTEPEGLQVFLDGQTSQTPLAVLSVVGVHREISVPAIQQGQDGRMYEFSHWSNAASKDFTYIVGDNDSVFTAVFNEIELDTLVAPIVHDAYVRDGANGNNTYGTTDANQLVTKYTGINNDGFNRMSYLMFDISEMENAEKVYLNMFGNSNGANVSVEAYGVDNIAWNENTLTWNNRPPYIETVLDVVTVNTNTGQYFRWDVSNFVKQKILANQQFVSLAIMNNNVSEPQTNWNSKESNNNHPFLQVLAKDALTSVTRAQEQSLKVYPVPTHSELYIELPDGLLEGEYIIYNAMMDRINKPENFHAHSPVLTIPLDPFPNGIYFLVIQDAKKTFSSKFMIQR